MASEKTILLTQLDPTGLDGGRERENRERKERGKRKENSRVRSSHFSLDFQRSDRRLSARQEEKLIPTARAMRGSCFYGVSTTPGGRGFLLLVLFFG